MKITYLTEAHVFITAMFAKLNTTREAKWGSNYNSCQAQLNKYEKGFLCLGRIQATSLFSQSSKGNCVPAKKHLGHTEAAPPQSLSDSDTLTSAVLFTKLLLLSLISEPSLEDMQWKLNFTLSHHLKKTSHVLWDVIENHDLAWNKFTCWPLFGLLWLLCLDLVSWDYELSIALGRVR